MKTTAHHALGAAVALALLAGCASSGFGPKRPAARAEPPPAAAPPPAREAAPPAVAPASSAPATRPVLASTIYFDSDVYRVKPIYRAVLAQHVQELRADPARRLVVQAHTDAEGPDHYNRALAAKRADTVIKLLAALGASRTQLVPVPLGESRPAVNGDDVQAMARNRRVELLHGDAAFAQAQLQEAGAPVRMARGGTTLGLQRIAATKPARRPVRDHTAWRTVALER